MTNAPRITTTGAAAAMAALLTACTAQNSGRDTTPSATPSARAASPTPEAAAAPSDQVVGTRVHFTAGSTVVAVTITDDTATTRDFLARLPMAQEFEDFHGQEKITYPDKAFDYTGTQGMTPHVGDLFSYKPWGNLGFFYGVDGLGHSEELVRLGTTTDIDKVEDLGGQRVTIEVDG